MPPHASPLGSLACENHRHWEPLVRSVLGGRCADEIPLVQYRKGAMGEMLPVQCECMCQVLDSHRGILDIVSVYLDVSIQRSLALS